ncbi:MAG: site-2 protease family protein [Candidatus Peribacteria bacterium]|nr:MAG: site-2 protease family protein [Candidatus Peribacteria bacterium]
MISLALGLFNLLPIPALDGGRMLGVIIQSIGRIQPSTYYKIEGIINSVIMILLLGLGILIMAKDAAQFYCWENPLSQAAFGDSAHCIQPQQ